MAGLRLTTLFLTLGVTSAQAGTCVIVWSPGTNADAREKFNHEQAHCWGWEHPSKLSTFGAAYKVPSHYLLKGEFPGWKSPCGTKPCSVKQAKQLCDGHFGCQWFE